MAKRVTVTLSEDLQQAAELLRKRRKYRTFTEYVQALIRYDGQTQREHQLTGEWAALTGYERDRLDNAILRQVESGKGARGSWIEATIEEIVLRHMKAGQPPNAKEVAAELAAKLATSPPA
jgi:Arc/MetJ-type ribon-helix-helix transcriptional regulator